ncbi:MAG: MFS transporter [Thermodesulfobacteriota bacterium]
MAIYLIVLMCTLNHTGYGGSRVAISLYALDLGASQLAIGMLMALYALCPLLLAVTIGKLADRVGPRLPMLMGTAGVTVALLLPPLFPGLVTLYITALLIGTSFHFFFITVTGIAGGIGGEENRVRNYALVSLGFAGAGFLGPMTAGFSIDYLGRLPTFIVLSLFTLFPLALLWFRAGFLPAAGMRMAKGGKRNAFDLWRVPVLRNTFMASGILSSAWDLFQFYMPVYGHSIGLSASVIGTVLGVFAVATFVIRIVLPYLTRKVREADIITYAIFVAALAFVLFPFFQNALALAAISFLLGLGCGCGQPLSMSLIYALTPRERVSEAAGLRVTVNNVGHLAIPLLFGSVGTVFGYFPVFLSNAVMLVGGGLLMRRNVVPESGLRREGPGAI